jgi:hypothetical protein
MSAISFSQLVDESAEVLTGKSPEQGEGDEPPAVSALYPQVDDDRNGNVDIEIPGKRKFSAILPQVTEGDVNGYCKKDEPDEG